MLSPRPRVATTTVTAGAGAEAASRIASATHGTLDPPRTLAGDGDLGRASRPRRGLGRDHDREARPAVVEIGRDGGPGARRGDEARERRAVGRLVARHAHLFDHVAGPRERPRALHHAAQASSAARRALDDRLLVPRAVDDELPRAAVDLETLFVDGAKGEE